MRYETGNYTFGIGRIAGQSELGFLLMFLRLQQYILWIDNIKYSYISPIISSNGVKIAAAAAIITVIMIVRYKTNKIVIYIIIHLLDFN